MLSDFPVILKIEDGADNDSLYTEFACLKAVVEILPKDLPNDTIWAHFFRATRNVLFFSMKFFFFINQYF